MNTNKYTSWRFLGAIIFLIATLQAYATPIDDWLASTPEHSELKQTINWKFSHPAPPVSHLPPVWQKGFDWLNQATQGKMTIKQYGGGTLYGIKGGFKALRAGIADMGTCYTIAEPKGFELFKTLQLPYIAPENPYLAARIINELMTTKLKSEFNKRGVYPAHVIPVRPLTLMSKVPIRTPEDLKGKKIYSLINAPGAANDLGYSHIMVPFPELYTALQQGLLDAIIWVDMGFIPFKIYEQAKYYTNINIAPSTIETCMNRRSFDRLPSEAKQTIYDLQQKLGIALVDKTDRFSLTAKQTYLDNGVEIIDLTEQQKQQWQKAFQPSIERWMDQCTQAGKDCRGLVKDIERLKTKYQKLSNEELMRLAIEEPVQGIIEF